MVSFDYFVGACCQAWRHVEAKRFRCLEADHELELGRLYDRQIAGLLTSEQPAGVDPSLTIGIGKVRAVARQAASHDKFTSFIYRRNGVACCERNDLIALVVEERVGANQQCSGT